MVVLLPSISEAHEITKFLAHVVIFELELTHLLLNILIFKKDILLLFINYSDLFNQVFSCTSLVVLLLNPRKHTVCLEQLPLILMNDLLVLLSLSLHLKVMVVDLLLDIQVFLNQLVPFSLTLLLSLLKLFDYPFVFYIFFRYIFK
jgi:hypothetical protein